VRAKLGLAMVVMVGLCIGCGEQPSAPPVVGKPEDQTPAVQISLMMDELREAMDRPTQLPKLFAKGVTPPPVAQLRRYDIRPSGQPSVSGETATLSILFAKEDDPNKTIAQKNWTFVQEGKMWKIKDAPLP